jgi:hypothetical protein
MLDFCSQWTLCSGAFLGLEQGTWCSVLQAGPALGTDPDGPAALSFLMSEDPSRSRDARR